MKLFKERFAAYAQIYVYDLYYKDSLLCTFYTKDSLLMFKRQFEKTPLYYYGTIEDTHMSDHLRAKKRTAFIETEIDFAKLSKMTNGTIETIK
jgi:hypothetical protein